MNATTTNKWKRLREKDTVGLVTYATEAKLEQVLTSTKASVSTVVRSLLIDPKEEVGSTNTGDALHLGNQELNSSRHNPDARKVLVLLTDGLANAPEDDPEAYAQRAAELLKGTNTEIFTIGLGDSVNETFLQTIATGDDKYFRAVSIETLEGIYESITAAICEDGPAIIDIIPKSEASFAPLR